MRFIHCSDLHLGSSLSELPQGKVRERKKNELLNSFWNLIDYANLNKITNIILTGDVFDSDIPALKDKELFYDLISANPQIHFFYLRGNHDNSISYTKNFSNLTTFTFQEWKTIFFNEEKITLNALECSNFNDFQLKLNDLNLNTYFFNIVLFHGVFKEENAASLKNNLALNYLALGHYHKAQIFNLSNGKAVYPGCLVARGFDEANSDKGFFVLNINEHKLDLSFIKLPGLAFYTFDYCFSSDDNKLTFYDLSLALKKSLLAKIPQESCLQLILRGEIKHELLNPLKSKLESDLTNLFCYLKIKNETTILINTEETTELPCYSLKSFLKQLAITQEDLNFEDKIRLLEIIENKL